LESGDGVAWAALGRSYQALGRDSDAARAFAKASEVGEGGPDTLLALADACAKEGRVDEADAALRKARAAAPADAVLQAGIAERYVKIGRVDPAVAAQRAAVELTGELAMSIRLGELLLLAKDQA